MAEDITLPSFLCCEVCQIQTNSEEQLREHLLGQKHWQNARQRDLSRRSIYVRGFEPKTTTVSDLTELFQQFGSIQKVVLHEKGHYALIEFSSVESCLQALHHPTRLMMNGKKLVVKPREMKVKRPSTKSESDSKEEEMGSLDASGQESVEGDEYSKVELKIERELMERITSLETLDEQIILLASTQQSPPSLALAYIKVLQYLQSAFSEVFPSCRLVPFGSFVTGASHSDL
ncbi:PREDICTED: speckle targeted PIP5K1A-regulated poly(A) polymerase-like [Amphimedon queenslandica]|uniref:RRM domain-containing protein n=2 Tax=Amphimedon queenslandica TaxID=400682 RepID=A0AAN0J9J2_AMPQE|nr:PREDICTED: speckle targeted PIP5K1A-regulated poly(A) polymerase-like [Amphimedon queenslandica]|eukprot:XP_019853396.1 PREDICTED: speckle targeted PIP5K1A-regulated poly(A) polymerase-like [Amphimedon queenslandica]